MKELRLADLEEFRDLIEASGSGPSAAAKYADLAKLFSAWASAARRDSAIKILLDIQQIYSKAAFSF